MIANKRDRAIFLTAYRHGLRASEIGLLRTDDLDLNRLRVMMAPGRRWGRGSHVEAATAWQNSVS